MRKTVFALLLLFVAFDASARGIDAPEYAELVDRSDLIVVVQSRGTRKPKADDIIVPVDADADELQPVVTEFRVLAIIKGMYTRKEISLSHYQYKPGIEPVANGPMLVAFPVARHQRIQIGAPRRPLARLIANDFVLFLKRDDEERLTFVTGQFDAEPSVRQITFPVR